MPESAKFYPIEVPPSATSRGAAVIGTNAGQNIGVTVDMWSGSTERGKLNIDFDNVFEDGTFFPKMHNFYNTKLNISCLFLSFTMYLI